MAYEIIPLHGNAIRLTGMIFGRLTAIAPVARSAASNILWLCICQCGSETTTLAANLKRGNTQSCGCLQREHAGSEPIHGMTGTPAYVAWHGIKMRCFNENYEYFPSYGGRGITVCDRWINSFADFFSDMGEKPSAKHSIDRINNDGDYTPENCRWATARQQNNNKGNNKRITHNGKCLTHAQWSRRVGGSSRLVSQRVSRGWTEERAVTEPVCK